jgi:hypothetical protein
VFIRNLRNLRIAIVDHQETHKWYIWFDRNLHEDSNRLRIKGIREELQKINGVDGFLVLVGVNAVLKAEMQTRRISKGSDTRRRSTGERIDYHVE